MNTREQLIEWRDAMASVPHRLRIDGHAERFELLEKLIAERPYEPGEPVICGEDKTPSQFLCVDPNDPDLFLTRHANNHHILNYYHRNRVSRPPKTTRVKPVPEEKIEQAKKAAARENPCTEALGAALNVCDWLANPENWEDGND